MINRLANDTLKDIDNNLRKSIRKSMSNNKIPLNEQFDIEDKVVEVLLQRLEFPKVYDGKHKYI